MACNCNKRAQPTGFAKAGAPAGGAQAAQRAGAASVPGALPAGPLRVIPPTGSR